MCSLLNMAICSGINKPVAVKDWLEKAQPQEDYILIIDSDTIMREAFDVDEMGIRPGSMLACKPIHEGSAPHACIQASAMKDAKRAMLHALFCKAPIYSRVYTRLCPERSYRASISDTSLQPDNMLRTTPNNAPCSSDGLCIYYSACPSLSALHPYTFVPKISTFWPDQPHVCGLQVGRFRDIMAI